MTKVIYNYLHFRELLILGRLKDTSLVTSFTKHFCTASQFAIVAIYNNVAGAVRNRLLKVRVEKLGLCIGKRTERITREAYKFNRLYVK